MTKTFRKILLLVAATIFVAVAPAIVLYAIGYRLSTINGAGTSVGVLLVDAIPSKAKVEVDGIVSGSVPQAISGIEVGKVALKLFKEGYESWEKSLAIESTRATEARSIRLFPQEKWVSSIMKDIDDFSVSPNRSLLIIHKKSGQLQLIDLTGEELSPTLPFIEKPKSMLWSPNSTFVLLQTPSNSFFIYDVSNNNIEPLILTDVALLKDITWDPRVPGRLLMLQKNGSLIAINISTGQQTQLLKDVSLFSVSLRRIYALMSDQRLESYNLQGQLQETITTDIDKPLNKILATPSGNIALVFADQSLGIVNKEGLVDKLLDSTEEVSWSPSGQMLLIQTKHNELYIYNLEDKRSSYVPLQKLHLVIRLSRSITNPQWYAGGQHVIYQVDDEIIITEIDTRDYPISYTVDTTNNGSSKVTVGDKGDVIYYLKKDDKNLSLFKADLLTPQDQK